MACYNPAMQKASFTDDGVEVVSAGRVSKRVAKLDGLSVTLVTFGKGASVAEDGVATGFLDTELCEEAHVGYVLQGALGVRQRDGSEEVFRAGDVMLLPPGHDAWTVGDEDFVFVQFSRGSDDYYGESVSAAVAKGVA
jgi:ethanolamine utilization protein EutQ (cupin superfamily)